ncbi:hypothetical protein PUNSTDRAFT_35641, partial [Punctularia strigosozonata HHB-11173 SS5]
LDVDDPIWQDAGLLEDESASPPWLTNDKVQSGIRAMLESDRCKEELARISRERGIMQNWLREEWAAVDMAQTSKGEYLCPGMLHQLQVRREELLQLAVIWRRRVSHISSNELPSDAWGPTDAEMAAGIHVEYTESTADQFLPREGILSSENSDDEDPDD